MKKSEDHTHVYLFFEEKKMIERKIYGTWWTLGGTCDGGADGGGGGGVGKLKFNGSGKSTPLTLQHP